MRVRLLLGMVLTLVVAPLVTEVLPSASVVTYQVLGAAICEVLMGLLLGTCLGVVMSALDLAGDLISQQLGLSNAALFNPAIGHQSNLTSTFLSMAGVTLLFVTDLDHLILRALVSSYHQMPPFELHWTGDWVELLLRYIQAGLVVAVQIAAPLLVCITIFFVGLGLLNRLLPVVQIFFISQSVQVGLGLLLFGLTAVPGLKAFAYFVETQFTPLVMPARK
jgi:flagellar biosynthetic protein FliR